MLGKLVKILEPPSSIQVRFKGGQFDFIKQGWRVPYELADNFPFRVIQENRPSLTNLAHRTLELGDKTHASYVHMQNMPWPHS